MHDLVVQGAAADHPRATDEWARRTTRRGKWIKPV
ncbi:hypothetical protein HDG32_000494 [Paraburkholderia sp. CI2]|nr:hypothetical protein [Paraburkholderia sp. CI2]